MTRIRALLPLVLAILTPALFAQDLNLGAKQDFLDMVAPIITRSELEIYEKLADADARRYFQNIFWYKRDIDPNTSDNPFRRAFFENRQVAQLQFGEGDTPGYNTDRGRLYLLLGEPDKVEQKQLPATSALPSYEETWIYEKHALNVTFTYDGKGTSYRMQDKPRLEPAFELIRDRFVVDRAEPYNLVAIPLILPKLGFTKDIENLVSEDKSEIRFVLSYDFEKGDHNRTGVLVGLTLLDASNRGVDLNFTAFDPYGNKVIDFIKRIEPANERFQNFPLAIEPDQYQFVLRLKDKDGRESIDRRTLTVPRIGPGERSASSTFLSDGPVSVPLQGFRESKQRVFGNLYVPFRNDFASFKGEKLYVLRYFYGFETLPEIRFAVDGKEVTAQLERSQTEEDSIRTLHVLDLKELTPGVHELSAYYRDLSGDWRAENKAFGIGTPAHHKPALLSAALDPAFELAAPLGDSIAELKRVALKWPSQIPTAAQRGMWVYLNETLVAYRDRSPWAVTLDPGLFSISGTYRLSVVALSDKGLHKVERNLRPLKVDENIKTRLVSVFFNAFDEKLAFVNEIDTSKLQVKVDGVEQKPKAIEKLEDPITYCFVVDNSYSMRESFATNIRAVKSFIDGMRPQDQGYFVAFSDHYTQHLTPNRSKSVLKAVADNLTVARANPRDADRLYDENNTFLFDAVIASIHTLLQYSGRKVIVLVTDGVGIEGEYKRNGMLSYARENDVVIYSLWLDNNPRLSEDENKFLAQEVSKSERFARAIGLTRFFADKDARKNLISSKIRESSINEGVLKLISEESGGFHYQISRSDRAMVEEFVHDIERAVASQFVMRLNLPVSLKTQSIELESTQPGLRFRLKSEVKVRKTNPLGD